jgi:homoserine kinase type II
LSCAGWEKLVAATAPRANTLVPGLAEFITTELAYLNKHWASTAALPHGVIHGDLFPDNVLFQGKKLYGLIDFYFACNDKLAYDLAVCANAWCFENDEEFSYERMEALMGGYESVRPLSQAERNAMPLLLRGAALRFLLTRLYDFLNQPEGAMVKVKDPLEYYNKLQFFIAHPFERAKAVPTYKA